MMKMKKTKRMINRFFAGVLATAMLLSMTSCGKGRKPGEETENSINSELAKINVYSYEELNAGENLEISSNCFPQTSAVFDDEVNVVYLNTSYDSETSTSNYTVYLHSVKFDGTGSKVTTFEAPVNTVPEPTDDDINEGKNEDAKEETDTSEEGNVITPRPREAGVKMESRKLVAPPAVDETVEDLVDSTVDTDVDIMPDVEPVEDEEEDFYSYEYDYYNNFLITADKVYCIRQHTLESYNSNGYESSNNTYVNAWTKDGKLVLETELDLSAYQNDEKWSDIRKLFTIDGKKVYGLLIGNDNGFLEMKEDGTFGALKSFGEHRAFQYFSNLTVGRDGKLILSYFDENYTKQSLCTLDLESKTFGEEVAVPNDASNNGFWMFSAGIGYDIMYSGNDSVYAFNIGDTESTKLMDFVNSDLPVMGMSVLVPISEDRFYAVYNSIDEYDKYTSAFFTAVKPEDVPDKQVLVFAGMYIDSNEKKRIINYNKSNSKYRIVIRDYSQYNTTEDYQIGTDRLNTDIVSGNVPDIIKIDNNMQVDSYISKGLFADVDELIANDPEISQIEFMQNVFDAYRVNGKLYEIIPSFYICSMVGKKSIFGDTMSITMEELEKIQKNYPDAKLLENMSSDTFMNYVMSYAGRDFIDVNTGMCDFNSPQFIALLKYAANIPEPKEIDYGGDYDEEYWQEYWQEQQTQFMDNRTLLLEIYLYEFGYLRNHIGSNFNEEVAYVGFPTSSDCGSFVSCDNRYAISAKSACKQGAWDYLKVYLTEDYYRDQKENSYFDGIPVSKNLVYEEISKLKEKSYYMEDGKKVEYDDTFFLGDEEIVIPVWTQKQVDDLFQFVCSIKKARYNDQDVIKIISEEFEAVKANKKSAEEAAALIQNRVQLYVNENR